MRRKLSIGIDERLAVEVLLGCLLSPKVPGWDRQQRSASVEFASMLKSTEGNRSEDHQSDLGTAKTADETPSSE